MKMKKYNVLTTDMMKDLEVGLKETYVLQLQHEVADLVESHYCSRGGGGDFYE